MNDESEQQREVSSLEEYRRKRREKQKASVRDAEKILGEVSYYLLKAAQAMTSQKPR